MNNLSNLNVYSPTPLARNDFVGIKKALDEDGVCVVEGILEKDERELFLGYFWEAIMKRHSKLKRDDVSTWTEENTDWLGTYGAGQYKVLIFVNVIFHRFYFPLCSSIMAWHKKSIVG